MSRYLVSEHKQGTEGWLAARRGRATGSKADAVCAVGRSGGESATRQDYLHDLVIERLTGRPVPNYLRTRDIEWGHEQEPFARMAYEQQTGHMVEEAGFCYLPHIMAGCSVDGFIRERGRLGFYEAKCPKSKTHLLYLESGVVPNIYMPQVLHNFWITGAEFCDFMSYDPRFPDGLQSMIVRVERSEPAVAAHASRVEAFLTEVDALESRLRMRLPGAVPAAPTAAPVIHRSRLAAILSGSPHDRH